MSQWKAKIEPVAFLHLPNTQMNEEEMIQIGDEVELIPQAFPAQLENPEGGQT